MHKWETGVAQDKNNTKSYFAKQKFILLVWKKKFGLVSLF